MKTKVYKIRIWDNNIGGLKGVEPMKTLKAIEEIKKSLSVEIIESTELEVDESLIENGSYYI